MAQNDSTTTYEGRHRDVSREATRMAGLREYRFKWLGNTYSPRHSASHREQVSA